MVLMLAGLNFVVNTFLKKILKRRFRSDGVQPTHRDCTVEHADVFALYFVCPLELIMTAQHTLRTLLATVQLQRHRPWDKWAMRCDITRWPWACSLTGIVSLSLSSVPLLALLAFLRDSHPMVVNGVTAALCWPVLGGLLALERIERVNEMDAGMRRRLVQALQRLNSLGTEQDKAHVAEVAVRLTEDIHRSIHAKWWSRVEHCVEQRIAELTAVVAIVPHRIDIEGELNTLIAQPPSNNRLKL